MEDRRPRLSTVDKKAGQARAPVLHWTALVLFLLCFTAAKSADQYRADAKRLLDAHDDKAALHALDECLRVDPRSEPCLVMHGKILSHAGARETELQTAIADFTKAIAINAKSADGYLGRGLAYRDYAQLMDAKGNNGSDLLTKSIADLRTALPLDPANPTLHFARGTVYLLRYDSLNDLADVHHAVDDFTRAIQLNPKNGVYYRWRAKAYKALGMIDEAATDEAKALELK